MGHNTNVAPHTEVMDIYQKMLQDQADFHQRQKEWLDDMPNASSSDELELAARYRADLQRVRELARLREPLISVEATLRVNFGKDGHVLPGVIDGQESLIPMLMKVLEALSKRAGLIPQSAKQQG